MAEPSSFDAFLRGFTRVMLMFVLVALTNAVFYLFPDIHFLPWCYVALGVVYLSWFVYDYRRNRLEASSFVVPLLLGAGVFIVYWFIDAVIQVKEARPRVVVANDLKQIGMALQQYHDKHGSFPPRQPTLSMESLCTVGACYSCLSWSSRRCTLSSTSMSPGTAPTT
jgi:hypothetical protein